MMRRRIEDVAARDVALWCLRTGHSLPVPLSGGTVADVVLTAEERQEAGGRRPDDPEVPHPAAPLETAAPLLTAPHWGVWAGRLAGGTGRGLLVVGLVRGDDALVVTEHRASWQLQRVPASALVDALLAHLPPLRPASVDPVELDGRLLEEVGRRSARSGSAQDHLVSRGVEPPTAALIARVHAEATAAGVVGAMTFTEGGSAMPVEDDARWFESRAGSVLTSTGTDRRTRLTPASAAGLRAVVAGLAAAARRASRRELLGEQVDRSATGAAGSVRGREQPEWPTPATADDLPEPAPPRWTDHVGGGLLSPLTIAPWHRQDPTGTEPTRRSDRAGVQDHHAAGRPTQDLPASRA